MFTPMVPAVSVPSCPGCPEAMIRSPTFRLFRATLANLVILAVEESFNTTETSLEREIVSGLVEVTFPLAIAIAGCPCPIIPRPPNPP